MGILSGDTSGGGGILASLGQSGFGQGLARNPNMLMSLGSAMLGNRGVFSQGLAQFGQQAPQAMMADQHRAALNNILKAKNAGGELDPATLQYMKSDPEFADQMIQFGMVAHPKQAISTPYGVAVFDPYARDGNNLNYQMPGGTPTTAPGAATQNAGPPPDAVVPPGFDPSKHVPPGNFSPIGKVDYPQPDHSVISTNPLG